MVLYMKSTTKIDICIKWANFSYRILQKYKKKDNIQGFKLRRLALKLLKRHEKKNISKWKMVANRVIEIINQDKIKANVSNKVDETKQPRKEIV